MIDNISRMIEENNELKEFQVNLIREFNTINIIQKENSIKTPTELRSLEKESGVKNTPI